MLFRSPAEQRAYSDDENVEERVLRGARHARIGEVLEVLDQTEFGMRLPWAGGCTNRAATSGASFSGATQRDHPA